MAGQTLEDVGAWQRMECSTRKLTKTRARIMGYNANCRLDVVQERFLTCISLCMKSLKVEAFFRYLGAICIAGRRQDHRRD